MLVLVARPMLAHTFTPLRARMVIYDAAGSLLESWCSIVVVSVVGDFSNGVPVYSWRGNQIPMIGRRRLSGTLGTISEEAVP